MSNWRGFTEEEQDILYDTYRELDEFHVENRKGISQTKYVFEVKAGNWYNWKSDMDVSIPEDLVGTWMMAYADDLSYKTLPECIKRYDWVKCQKLPRTTYHWEEIKGG